MQTVRSTEKISRPHESILSKATKSEIGIILTPCMFQLAHIFFIREFARDARLRDTVESVFYCVIEIWAI